MANSGAQGRRKKALPRVNEKRPKAVTWAPNCQRDLSQRGKQPTEFTACFVEHAVGVKTLNVRRQATAMAEKCDEAVLQR